MTGKQIAESTLGHVPFATKAGTAAKLRPLAWHGLSLANSWSALVGDRAPAYAVDAEGIVHLRGALCCGEGVLSGAGGRVVSESSGDPVSAKTRPIETEALARLPSALSAVSV